jgi:hypothetical protein
MLLDRLQSLGILLICAAMSVAGWKSLSARSAAPVDAIRPVSAGVSPGRGELTIPVEIVESGEEPRFRDVRVTR